jgi:hypothetical protein
MTASLAPSFRPSRLSARARALAAGLAGLAVVAAAGCASAAPLNPDNLPAPRIAQIDGICRSVMGLEAGEEHYVNCALSLSHSVYRLDRTRGMQTARDDCVAKGLKPGDVQLSECELSVFHAGAKPVAYSPALPAGPPAKSLFYASTTEIRHREQQACAMVGYDPIYGPFTDCVANLQSAMFAADHPLN